MAVLLVIYALIAALFVAGIEMPLQIVSLTFFNMMTLRVSCITIVVAVSLPTVK